MKVTENALKEIKPYEKDKDKFYLLNLISQTVDSLISSDNSTYIIGRSRVGLPTWIWTLDDIDKVNLESLENDLKKYLEEGKNKITCKKELYDLLKEKYKTSKYFEMGYLSCSNLIKPTKLNGIFVRPNYGDKTSLSKLWIANEKEMENIEVSENDALETVDEWIEKKNFYVLKDRTGKIVCMAGYSKVDSTAKITHVYTPQEERQKGYCKTLIYYLSKKLQEDGLKPMLYTDYNYIASNSAYKSVGYIDEGILINFTITK